MVSTRQKKQPRRSHRNELPAHGSSSRGVAKTARTPRSRRSPTKSVPSTPRPLQVLDCTGDEPVDGGSYTKPKSPPLAKAPPTFLLSITVRHKEHIIHQYASMHQADTFSYADLMATEAQKVSEWSTKKRIGIVRRGGTATIACDYKQLKPVSTQVDDPDNYKAAEGIAIALACEGKKGVRMVVEILYDLEDLEEPELDKGLHSEEETAMPTPMKAKKTTTSVLLEAARERRELSQKTTYMAELIRQWRCEDSHCHNNGKPCYIVDGKHHHIQPTQLNVWDRGIVVGTATLEHPPPGMVFQPVVKSRSAAPPPPVLPAYPFPPPYAWPAPFPPPAGLQLVPHLPPPPQVVPPALPAPATSDFNQRSSPVGDGDDPDALLAEYLEWTCRRVPSARDDLGEVLRMLKDEYHDVEGIKAFTDDDWLRMGVPIGLGRRLARDVRVFKRERRGRQ